MTRDVSGVDGVAVATGTGVQPNVCTLLGREFVEDLVVQVHERLE